MSQRFIERRREKIPLHMATCLTYPSSRINSIILYSGSSHIFFPTAAHLWEEAVAFIQVWVSVPSTLCHSQAHTPSTILSGSCAVPFQLPLPATIPGYSFTHHPNFPRAGVHSLCAGQTPVWSQMVWCLAADIL